MTRAPVAASPVKEKPCHPRECTCRPDDDPPQDCPLGYRAPVAAPPSDELVKRLESWERFFEELPEFHEDIRQALALISSQSAALEAQANQIKGMKEALEPFAKLVDDLPPEWADAGGEKVLVPIGDLRRARSARG